MARFGKGPRTGLRARLRRRRTLRAKVNKIARAVRLQKPELKYYDLSLSVNPDYNGTIVNLMNSITQGDTQNQRNGSKIRLHSIQFKGIMTGNVAANAVSQVVRFMIVLGNNENTTNLTVPNLLQVTGTVNTPYSPYNWDQRSKYTIMKDMTKIVPAGEAVGAATTTNISPGYKPTYIKMYKRLNKVVTFNAATINVINHGLYYCFVSDSAASLPQVNGYFRVTYTDV